MVRGSHFQFHMLLLAVVLLAPPRSMNAAYHIANLEGINALNITYVRIICEIFYS